MANDVDVPLVEVLQHPRVRKRPTSGIATKVKVNHLAPCQPSAESVDKHLLWVDPVTARSAIKEVPRRESKLVLHFPLGRKNSLHLDCNT
jgi:hypothetical protein